MTSIIKQFILAATLVIVAFFAFSAMSSVASAWDGGTGGDGGCCGGEGGAGEASGGSFGGGEADWGSFPPSCLMSAQPFSIVRGESAALKWSTYNASTASINNGIGGVTVGTNKSYTVSPQNTTTYTMTVRNVHGQEKTCATTVKVTEPPVVRTCDISANLLSVKQGDSVTISWSTTNFDIVTINGETMSAGSGSKTYTNIQTATTFNLVAKTADNSANCNAKVVVQCELPPAELPICKSFTATPGIFWNGTGGTVTLNWNTVNTSSVTIDQGVGTFNQSVGSTQTQVLAGTNPLPYKQTFTLTAYGADGKKAHCSTDVYVKEKPVTHVPTCDAFSANPTTIVRGSSSTLTWSTTNATAVYINNGIGQVADDGTKVVSPLETTIYTLTVVGTDHQKAYCEAKVIVHEPEDPAPICESFTIAPTVLPYGGGSAVLSWTTRNADVVSIDQGIGVVLANGSRTVSVTNTTTYTMMVANQSGDKVSCTAKVIVQPPVDEPITCADNVSFSANPDSFRRGQSTTLTWNTTGITSLSFNQGITATGLSGSVTVSPTSDTTYILTATDGKDTIACPVPVNVTTSGGGGGTILPRCELTASKTTITAGERVTLEYSERNANRVTLEDDKGNTLFDTEDDDDFNGEIVVRPTEDTEYTYTVYRGSRDRECTVDIDVRSSVVVVEQRDQQPLVAGISLSQVPYTGFEAGPFLTFVFYTLLLGWAMYLAYILVIKRDTIGGVTLATAAAAPTTEVDAHAQLFTSTYTKPVFHTASVPNNLPTTPVASVAPVAEPTTTMVGMDQAAVAEIENRAHAAHVLMSSDALRYFMTTTEGQDRIARLDEVIATATAQYPTEDGWVVLNADRMHATCETCLVGAVGSTSEVAVGAGSLAEAIVTGNIVAAYQMIGHRPMIALADAAADLDAAYRAKQGESVTISDLLMAETATISEVNLHAAINALTGALDGTYDTEEEAVKMAIMKAVKAIA